jgi:hypothetical protein
MKNSNTLKKAKGIQLGALFMACCIFTEATAGGLITLINFDKIQNQSFLFTHPKNVSLPSLSSEKQVERKSIEHESIVSLTPQVPGGPDQPEVQSFSPIGTSDMVDPFTGDFSYNIPLMDVDGYPINIAYSAGVSMDQEASWVGLGWNLNPGVMNRVLRGLPDDFNGDKGDVITKEMNQKKNTTVGVTLGGDLEFFGLPLEGSGSISLNFNNYQGVSSSFSISPSFSPKNPIKGLSLDASLGISGSSSGGASLSPNLTFSTTDNKSTKRSIEIGSTLNSRAGLSASISAFSRKEMSKNYQRNNNKTGEINSTSGYNASSSFNFGNITYSPNITMQSAMFGGSFAWKLGPDFVGNDVSATFKVSYSAIWYFQKHKSSPAFGYMNLGAGQKKDKVSLDFSRENDGGFSKNTPALPITSLNYDIFSPTAHGVSGSYRPVRNEIGYVHDENMNTFSTNGDANLETDLGSTLKGGIDLSVSFMRNESGDWDSGENRARNAIGFVDGKTFFREANELSVDVDPTHFNKIGGFNAVKFPYSGFTGIQNTLKSSSSNFPNYHQKKNGTPKRNQVVYMLTNEELESGAGINEMHPDCYANGNADYNHHIGQFTVLNTEGTRYVYGIAAYSHYQKTVSFAVGAPNNNYNIVNQNLSQVRYSSGSDNSLANNKGIDNYFNSETTPAYAHSYLLTSVVNPDYVDIDNIKGPSKGDLGGYMTINYQKINNFLWRTPIVANPDYANYDEGLHSDNMDDKGHYTSGEKELWYVQNIKSKNHIAIFHTSNRADGTSINENGFLNTGGPKMQKLDSISLYSLPDYEANSSAAIPLKVVHFEYDYTLCLNYPLNGNSSGNNGKLTLKRVYFTYQHSNKGRYSSYKFDYSALNPTYNSKSVDRWGTYKPQPSGLTGVINVDPLRPSDFPYVDADKSLVDSYVSAWNLKRIHLPSGGKIEVDYESDDYAYVQHKRANDMFKIVGVLVDPIFGSEVVDLSGDAKTSTITEFNSEIYFELAKSITNPTALNLNINEYRPEGNLMYFRALMKFNGNNYDFVPGYAEIDNIQIKIVNGDTLGAIKLKGAKLKDNGPAIYNPIAIAGIQFGRMQLSKFIPPANSTIIGDDDALPGIADALVGAYSSFAEFYTGPNGNVWAAQVGTDLVVDKSWIRLQNPNKLKLGGGYRVKQIRIYDAWDVLTNNEMSSYFYGQDYIYNNSDGTSNGVASYEPAFGADENPFQQPEFYSNEMLLAPDERNYQMNPFGQQFFPTASVGYSKVVVRDIQRENVSRTATGKVEHEFYTAKEFPTIVGRTDLNPLRQKSTLFTYFFNKSKDEMTASQGFVIETNDMHGKQKSQHIYAANQNSPISSVEYHYKSEAYTYQGALVKRLVNSISSITKSGSSTSSTIGINYEAVADFRKSKSETVAGSVDFNINFTIPFILVPTTFGTYNYDKTAFRSATFTKVIERFGILETTIAKDLGSEVKTQNLAYDSETGSVLLTKTQTNFNDAVYNLTVPAHWYYDQMGQAYHNIDFEKTETMVFIAGGSAQLTGANLSLGDELVLTEFFTNIPYFAWVTDVSSNGVKLMAKNGELIQGTFTKLKVIRSGRRNLQMTPIGTITLRNNPLGQISTNFFEQVLQAGATEYSDNWRTFCECFVGGGVGSNYTTNPYVLGNKGTWRPFASYVHLSGRDQTYEQQNSNIRNDGFMTSFNPFYKLANGKWNIDRQNWTYTSSVTEFSPFGQALETKDALNRFTSSIFGYNQTLATAVAANTRYRELGYNGFEDYDYVNCSDNHFKIASISNLVNTESHTGRYSLRVSGSNPITFSAELANECEIADCEIKITITDSSNIEGLQSIDYSFSGGVQPYIIDVETINGTVNFENTTSGKLNLQGFTNTKARITVRDQEGCYRIFEFKN